MWKLYTTKLINIWANRPEMKFYLVIDYTLPSTWLNPGRDPKWWWQSWVGISLKTRSCLSHLIKRESIMFSLRPYCLDFLIFTMIDSKFRFSPTFTSNLFFWTRNRNDIRLKHMISSTLIKCNSMIISIVMPSYPDVTLFLCYINKHWTTAHTLDMTINHKIP